MRAWRLVLCVLALFLPNFLFSQNLKFNEHDAIAGTSPIQMVRADFNGDTIPDLAVLNRDSSSITVFILNGDGTIRSHNDVAIGSGVTPTGIAVGDFNHDHIVDIVTCNTDPDQAKRHTLSLFLGNGDGTFQPPQFGPGGDDPTSIVVGDFDGDGNLDVATAFIRSPNGDPTLDENFVLFSFGDGRGGLSFQSVTGDVGEPNQPTERNRLINKLAVGDFDHDGHPDIAFTEINGGSDVPDGDVFILLNKGNGNFVPQPPINISVPVDIAVADVNQDGFDDILVTFSGCHTPCQGVDYLRSNGDGTFTNMPVFQFPDSQFGVPHGPSAGDINLDGLKDIIVGIDSLQTGHVQFAVSEQNADGTFAPPQFFDTQQSGDLASTVTADLTRDGRVDMAMSNTQGVVDMINATPILGCPAPSSTRALKVCLPRLLAGSSPMQILANTRDSLPIEAMKVYVDGVTQFTTTDDLLSARLNLSLGQHQIVVKAWDRLGAFAPQSFTFNAVTGCGVEPGTDRSVRICAPVNGSTVPAPVHLEAAANDSGQLLDLQIYVDGVFKESVFPSNAFDSTLTGIPSGNHRITVKGWDAAGPFSQTVNFTVQ